MAGTSKAEQRFRAFHDERLTGGLAAVPAAAARAARPGVPAEEAPPDPAAARVELLHEHRRRVSELTGAASSGRRRRRRVADAGRARAPATAIGQNWVPIGPTAVLRGQASTLPVVSGRVQDLAISSDGRRVYAATANGGVWRSVDGGDNWEPMSDEFDIDPLARQVDSLSCGAIALVQGADAARDRLYVGTGEGHAFLGGRDIRGLDMFGVGMLRSDNGGATWIQEPSAPGLIGASVYAIAVDPTDPDHAVAATTIGVFRRTAAVPTWTREALPIPLAPLNNVSGVAVGRNGGAVEFYVVTRSQFSAATGTINGGRIFRSAGTPPVWTELAGFPAGADRCSIAVANVDPPVIYVLSAAPGPSDRFHQLARYNLGRAAPIPWEPTTGAPDKVFGDDSFQGSYDQALAVDPNDPDICYVGGSGQDIAGEFSANIFRVEIDASAGGNSNPCTHTLIGGGAHADVHALVFRPGSSTELWAGSDGGVWRTTEAKGPKRDRVFVSRNIGLGTLTLTGLGHHPTEEAYAFCGAQDNGGVRYQGDEVWDHQLFGDGGDTVIDWSSGERLLSIYIQNRVRRAKTDGGRYQLDEVGPSGATPILFYPPLAGTPPSANPADAAIVALGARDQPWVTTNFGNNWTALPARPAAAGPPPPLPHTRALAFASPNRLWTGWTDGFVGRYDLAAGGWGAPTNLTNGGETRPVTSIAIDPSDATGGAVFVTLGGATGLGDRVWHLDNAGNWTTAGNGLLDVQANALAIDPTNVNRRWVATDLGVWQWDNGLGQWQPFSFNLPDAAALDIDLLPGGNVLRVTTYGRGVWELDLTATPTPTVDLAVRTNRLDTRRRAARAGVKLPGDLGHLTRLDESPDIIVDAPDNNGLYALDPTRPPNLVELLERAGARTILASVPDAPAVTRVHVVVRNRGVRPANPALDAVRVALLVGPAGDDDDTAPAQLPAGYEATAIAGTPIDGGGWKTVGIRTLDGLKVGRPGVVTFELSSTALPVADESAGKRFVLLALVHHGDDPFPAAPTRDSVALVAGDRRAALRGVIV